MFFSLEVYLDNSLKYLNHRAFRKTGFNRFVQWLPAGAKVITARLIHLG